MILAAMLAFIIDRDFLKAGLWALAATTFPRWVSSMLTT